MFNAQNLTWKLRHEGCCSAEQLALPMMVKPEAKLTTTASPRHRSFRSVPNHVAFATGGALCGSGLFLQTIRQNRFFLFFTVFIALVFSREATSSASRSLEPLRSRSEQGAMQVQCSVSPRTFGSCFPRAAFFFGQGTQDRRFLQ